MNRLSDHRECDPRSLAGVHFASTLEGATSRRAAPQRWRRGLRSLSVARCSSRPCLATSSGAVASSAHAFVDIPSTAGSKPINGVPERDRRGQCARIGQLGGAADGRAGHGRDRVGVRIDGLSRGYLLDRSGHPAGRQLPLIVVLGGVSASPTQEAERDELLPVVQSAARRSWSTRPATANRGTSGSASCCSLAALVGVDDVAIRAGGHRRRCGSTMLGVDQSYLVGFSNGGKLAYQVLCKYPGLFSAAAIVAATPLAAARPQVALPMLIAVGAKDPELPLQGHTQTGRRCSPRRWPPGAATTAGSSVDRRSSASARR